MNQEPVESTLFFGGNSKNGSAFARSRSLRLSQILQCVTGATSIMSPTGAKLERLIVTAFLTKRGCEPRRIAPPMSWPAKPPVARDPANYSNESLIEDRLDKPTKVLDELSTGKPRMKVDAASASKFHSSAFRILLAPAPTTSKVWLRSTFLPQLHTIMALIAFRVRASGFS